MPRTLSTGSVHSQRSTEAPMDFQFTSRPSSNIKPVWASQGDNSNTLGKRTHSDTVLPESHFPAPPSTPVFGSNNNVPFIFQASTPQTPTPHPWAPPPNFSPEKAFPQPQFQELKDVDMSDVSPSNAEEKENTRVIATGALRRVFKSRQRKLEKSRLAVARVSERDENDMSESEQEEEDGSLASPMTHKTSHHYTLNMPSVSTSNADTPYILLGYLQFFFNLSLVLVFLYLLLQFILTVQRDVEQRISEYSMDIVQEIAMCSSQYRNNLCATNPIPAMIQQCATWETCMNRDPTVVGRAKVGAELIAEVVNGFVEPISWKTLAFTLTSLSFLTVFVNTLLSLYRSRHQHGPAPYHASSMPPFPQHSMNSYAPQILTSWPRPWHVPEEVEEPSRRRRLEGGLAAKVK